MLFSEVLGQQQVKDQLVNLVKNNRLSHALLFSGKEGSGALSLAVAFAQYIVCEKLQNYFKPALPSLFLNESVEKIFPLSACGICQACVKSTQLIHPDIHFSFPTVSKKTTNKPIAEEFIKEWREFFLSNPYSNLFDWIELIKESENSQGKISAEECNQIIKTLSLKSFESQYKILIQWAPELMGNEGNKLLKLIEEPPPYTLLILVTENEGQLLSTITSRCQLIKIAGLNDDEVEDALINLNKLSKETAHQIALVSEGNFNVAQQVAEFATEDWQNLLRDWLNAIVHIGPIAQVKWIEEAAKLGREKQKQFLKYFLQIIEIALRQRFQEQQPNNVENEKNFAHRLNSIATIEQLQAIANEINHAIYYVERNAHAKMLFHALTIKFYYILKSNKLISLA